MTTRRHIGSVVLAVAALAAFGDGSAQGTGAPDGQGASRRSDTAALQQQLIEATNRSNQLAAEQNQQTRQILDQTNALVDASVTQSAEAEQTRQMAEASITQTQQALEYMKTLVNRNLQAAQSRTAFVERFLTFWSVVLALFVGVSGYFNWRVYRGVREKVGQAVDDVRNSGVAELRKLLAELRAERQVMLDDVARQKRALAKESTDS